MVVIAGALGVFGLVGQLAAARRHLVVARSNLSAARAALEGHDDAAARLALDHAAGALARAKAASSARPLSLLKGVPLLGSPARAAAASARAGMDSVAAGRALADASSSFPTSAAVVVDGRDLSAFHAAAARSASAIAVANAHLSAALKALDGPAGAMLPMVSGPAKALRTEVSRGREQLVGLGKGLSLLEDLTAPATTARILLLSQDSLELRATGGYIGSFGVIEFNHGAVDLVRYAATDELPPPDPPAAPPPGLAGYLPRYWSLSNVNWWPDFPTTAAAAEELFRRQGGGDVDGVIALTETAIARLIGVLGPLRLPSYPQPVVEPGFDQRVVNEVELKRPLDTPKKKFLIELSEVLFDHLFHMASGQLPGVAGAVRQSVGAGDIQLWFKDPARQARVAGTAIAGELPRARGDFLMVVDANLGASKANLTLTKTVTYTVERGAHGSRVGHVRIELRDEGPKSTINPFYNAYVRVYAPAGARLLRASALQAQQPAADGPYVVFIQPIVVQPGESGLVTFDYVLPKRLASASYSLTWVRQAGTANDSLTAVVDGRRISADARIRTMRVAGR